MLIKLSMLMLFTTTYSIVRYSVFGSVSSIHTPVYLLNKAIALASVCCLLFTVFNFFKQALDQTKLWGISAFHLACIHIVMSVVILNRDYFPKLFGTTQMNLVGELTVLFGVLASYAICHARHHNLTQVKPKVFQIIASVFILGHLISIGYSGWLEADLWYGDLPPISLLSFIIVMTNLLFFIIPKRYFPR